MKYRYTVKFQSLDELERFERFQNQEGEFNFHYDRVRLLAWTFCDERLIPDSQVFTNLANSCVEKKF